LDSGWQDDGTIGFKAIRFDIEGKINMCIKPTILFENQAITS